MAGAPTSWGGRPPTSPSLTPTSCPWCGPCRALAPGGLGAGPRDAIDEDGVHPLVEEGNHVGDLGGFGPRRLVAPGHVLDPAAGGLGRPVARRSALVGAGGTHRRRAQQVEAHIELGDV